MGKRAIRLAAIVASSTLALTGCQSLDLRFQTQSERSKVAVEEMAETAIDGYTQSEPTGGAYSFEYKDPDWSVTYERTKGDLPDQCRLVVDFAIKQNADRYLGLPQPNKLPADRAGAIESCVEYLGTIPEATDSREVASGDFTLLGTRKGMKFLVGFRRISTSIKPNADVDKFLLNIQTDVTGEETEMTG